jgi:choline kinase
VGFYKLGRSAAHALRGVLDEWVASGRDHEEYEEVFRVLFKSCVFGYELVGDLPWTEIDFPEDILKAERTVWPQIQALEADLRGSR